MTPVNCSIPHKPAEGKNGDCLRACVATILDLGREEVPHFAEDCGPEDGMLSFDRLTVFLQHRKMVPIWIAYDAAHPGSFEEIMSLVGQLNGDAHAILLCGTPSETDHAVVVKGGKVVHDPSWGGRHETYKPTSEGYYGFVFFGALV